jgi:penicillin-binding protein 2
MQNFLKVLNLDASNLDSIVRKLKKTPISQPIVAMDKMNWSQVEQFEFNSMQCPEVYIDKEFNRFYPRPSCSNFLGYVGEPARSEKTNRANMSIVTEGKNGIEQKFNSHLSGTPGFSKVEINVRGIIQNVIEQQNPISGSPLHLTIDANLQDKVASILDGHSAAAVVMDAANGQILAMVSTPGFDANNMIGGIESAEWKNLISNPRLPLTNKAVSLTYPPGSVFKPIVALAALESGVSKDEKFFCRGYYELGNRKFACWFKAGHGLVDMHKGILQSCNCYFYQLALKIGIDPIFKYANMLGIGSKPLIELPNVQSGIMPHKEWKYAKYGQKWTASDTLNTSIGQGYIMTSPLQLCQMFARILSGNDIAPEMILHQHTARGADKLVASRENLDIIRRAIIGVINDNGGLGARHKMNGMIFGGKTGTAQVISKRFYAEDLSSNSTPWELRNHGLFNGFIDFGHKKICCSLVIEHIGSGAATIPYAKEILLAAGS